MKSVSFLEVMVQKKNLAILQGHYMPDYCIPFEIIFHPAPGGNSQSERLNVYFFNFYF